MKTSEFDASRKDIKETILEIKKQEEERIEILNIFERIGESSIDSGAKTIVY